MAKTRRARIDAENDHRRVTRPRLRIIVKETRSYPTGHLRAQSDTIEYDRGSREVSYDEAIILGGLWVNTNSKSQQSAVVVGRWELERYVRPLPIAKLGEHARVKLVYDVDHLPREDGARYAHVCRSRVGNRQADDGRHAQVALQAEEIVLQRLRVQVVVCKARHAALPLDIITLRVMLPLHGPHERGERLVSAHSRGFAHVAIRIERAPPLVRLADGDDGLCADVAVLALVFAPLDHIECGVAEVGKEAVVDEILPLGGTLDRRATRLLDVQVEQMRPGMAIKRGEGPRHVIDEPNATAALHPPVPHAEGAMHLRMGPDNELGGQ